MDITPCDSRLLEEIGIEEFFDKFCEVKEWIELFQFIHLDGEVIASFWTPNIVSKKCILKKLKHNSTVQKHMHEINKCSSVVELLISDSKIAREYGKSLL